MTTACAWCDSVQSVALVALCRSGLSHGVCVACMPRAFGPETAKKYLETLPETHQLDCVNVLQATTEATTSMTGSYNHTAGGAKCLTP